MTLPIQMTENEYDRMVRRSELAESRVQTLTAELAGYKESHDKYCPSAARVRVLEAVMAWYADKTNYGTRVCNDGDNHFDVMESSSEEDAGTRARACLASETPADYTIDGDGVWMGGKWHPSGGPKSPPEMDSKHAFTGDGGEPCTKCGKPYRDAIHDFTSDRSVKP